jgi:acetate kinase
LILVVNTGSSSLKLSVIDDRDRVVADEEVASWDGRDTQAVAELLEQVGAIDAVGHRVVHGGDRHEGPAIIDDSVRRHITALVPLAPLHQPRALAGMAATEHLLPDVPAVACFDTAFHRSLPPQAATYALPASWRGLGIRRFGFHGLSHAWASARAAELIDRPAGELRLVTAHLGAGASLCAVAGGRSVDTTMGFTPLDGLVMATRSGSVDPGAVLWLLRQGFDPGTVADGLEHRSGLAGLAGGSGDLRQIIASADTGDADARLAYDVYLHRLRGSIAAMTASLGGIDGLVFTGGAGEHSPRVRLDTCAGLTFLGVPTPDPSGGAAAADADAVVGRSEAGTVVVVVHAREDLQIAAEVRSTLRAG